MKKTITNSGWNDFIIRANHKQQIWPGLKFPSRCWTEQKKINEWKGWQMNKTFLLIFYNLKCSRKQIQPQKSLQRNCLWHLGWSKQPPKTPIPPAPHPTLPPEPFTLAVFPNFTDCIAELFIKTVCNKNSYTLQLYKFLQFSPSSWTEATSKGKP